MSETEQGKPGEQHPFRFTRRPVDWACVMLMTASLLAHAALLTIAFLSPPRPQTLSLDVLAEDNRFVKHMLEPDRLDLDVGDAPDTLLAGDSGLRSDNRFGIKGPGDSPNLARARPADPVASLGVLSALRSNAPTSPFGRAGALGLDGAIGALRGNQDGFDQGVRGVGRGGGGAGTGGRGHRGEEGQMGHAPVFAGSGLPLPRDGVLASNFVGGEGVETRLTDLLDRGVMVDGQSVRLAAFQDRGALPYPVPTDEAVALYAEMERSRVLAGGDRLHLQIALVARQGELPERPRMDVLLVLDRSGSMEDPGKWSNAVAAVYALAEQLRPQDSFGLITYSDDATLDLAPQEVRSPGEVRRSIERVLEQRRPGGGTNIHGALLLASEHRPRRARPGDMGLVVLVSDGVATVGMTNPRELGDLARAMFDEDGVLTTTIGLGTDFSEETMLTVAREGNGSYHFVRRPAEVVGILREELTERAQAVAQALRVRVVLGDEVVVRQVYGSRLLSDQEHAAVRATEVATDQRLARELGIVRDRRAESEEGLRVHLGSFRRGDQHVILMELDVPPGPAGREAEVCRVYLEYKDLTDRGNERVVRDVTVTRVRDADEALASMRRTVKRTVLAFQAGEALQEAAEALRLGEVATARRVLVERRELLEAAADLWRDPALAADARLIERYETVLARAYPSWNDQDQRTLLLAMNYFGDRRMR